MTLANAHKRIQAEQEFKSDMVELLSEHSDGMQTLGCNVSDWLKATREGRLSSLYVLLAGEDPTLGGDIAGAHDPDWPKGYLAKNYLIPENLDRTLHNKAVEALKALKKLGKKHEWLLNEIYMDFDNQAINRISM